MYNESDAIYWLALRRIPRLGVSALRQSWESTHDVQAMWENFSATQPEVGVYLDAAQLELDAVNQQHIQVLTLSHSDYPDQLRHIADISPILYVRGSIDVLNCPLVSVVGTRRPSHYGIEATLRLTRQFVGLNYTIVSGMAKGIDAVAHRAAIEAGGNTIAVWGSGLDCVFPPEHQALAEQIVQHGVILSQYPLGTQAQSFTFPTRNKIIAGLSQIIIVAEAQAKSGSLLTAEAGFKYGRLVGAVPGSIHNIGSAGPHQLIKNGAKLVVDAADIVDTMVATKTAHHQNHPPVISVTASEEALLNQLQSGPQHVDELIRYSTQPAAEIVGTLAMLEIKGLVKQLAPGEYLKCS
jgi:DNA processing protein